MADSSLALPNAAARRVVMLCANDWRHDTRVTREAEAVAAAGHDVCVLYRANAAEPDCVRNGVRYRCVPRGGMAHSELAALLAVHARVLLRDASRVLRGRLSGAESLLQVLLLVVLAVPAVPLLLALVFLSRRFERARVMLASLIEPLAYLNEFAVRCEAAVVDERPDVIHAHDLITLSCGERGARRSGAALIYDAHELETGTNYWSLNALTHYHVRVYERALISAASGVITVSGGIADWLARHYRIDRPTVVQNVPVTLGEHGSTPGPGRLRATIGLPAATPLAVYVGAVTVDRGLEPCAHALEHYPELHFAMVGVRYAETEGALRRIGAERGTADRMHFVDPVPSSEVTSVVADADCALVPGENVCLSYYLSLPNKLFESIEAGLPIVASELPEIRNVVHEYGIGVVMDVENPRDIARATREVIEHRDRYVPTGDKRSAVARAHGWPVQRARLLQLYERVSRERPRTRRT